jgi:hypothetical protein
MYISNPFTPETGMYVIKRSKLQGPGEHFGLALPNFTVVDFGMETGIRLTDLYTFAEGKDIITDRMIPEVEHLAVYERLQLATLNPAAYDFWNWNCETFVNFLIGEEPRSDQILWLGVAIAVAAAAIAVRAKKG